MKATVRKQGKSTFAVYVGDHLYEGGFFHRHYADELAEQLNHQVPSRRAPCGCEEDGENCVAHGGPQ